MYREVPPNALFQGDLLVVPDVGLRAPDPLVLTSEEKGPRLCPTCHRDVSEPSMCPDQNCQAQLRVEKKRLRIEGLGVRQAANEKPFEKKNAQVVASLNSRIAMIVSHSCDIDQQGEICFNAVRPLTSLGSGMQTALKNGKPTKNYFYLPAGAGLKADAAVELNVQFSLPTAWFGQKMTYASPRKNGASENALVPFEEVVSHRLAAMTVEGLKSLYRAIFDHVTRAEMKLVFAPEFKIEEPEAARPNPASLPRRGWTIPAIQWAMRV